MKKSIIYLSFAIVAFTTNAVASNPVVARTVTTATYEKATPLCMAISKGELEIVKKFVEYGADVNEQSNGMSPLMVAARYNNVEIVRYLISKGAKISDKSSTGYTALKYAEVSKATDVIAYLK
ncbi:ankyrin repeat domain-containing protein [Flavobacterium kingsejongi]|uniref:Uncharacterized protein n=1 Tax=Flavobacterium kingsejongi TaxID=1678728 RepID=A0A2S1LP76_9FLAO|nr:ankyrin repeat domain-containing protein [Flavobacterium kingsejongi]AWG25555.1 hypothetical protein FK004_10065 [Flavobacterium kingsejongi]